MSLVTNIILSFSILEGNNIDVIEQINKGFEGTSAEGQGFRVPNDHNWYGGSKVLERPTFVAAFNYLDLDSLIRTLRGIKWKQPEFVQLFVCEQESHQYQLYYPAKKEGV